MYKMLIVLFAVVGLSSCGTVAGFGDDIKSVAKWSETKMSEASKEEEKNEEVALQVDLPNAPTNLDNSYTKENIEWHR